MAFRYLPHTADVMFEASAETLEELFSESARALTHIMTDGVIVDRLTFPVSCTASSLEMLLFSFLSELIVLLDVEGLFVSSVATHISSSEGKWSLSGVVHGDVASSYEHHGDVKAPTYHRLFVGQENGLWIARATVDI